MNSSISNRRLLVGLLIALVAWGIFLSIGATGYFADAFDLETSYQKSLIVLLCMAAFLALWAGASWLQPRSSPEGLRWSVSALLSLAFILTGIGLWIGAIATWDWPPPRTAVVAGWMAITLAGAANVAAVVGLSEPRSRSGKWAGLITLALTLLCIVVFFVRTISRG
jgi:hypothetical protein